MFFQWSILILTTTILQNLTIISLTINSRLKMSFSFSEEEIELLKSLREQTAQEFARLKGLHSETRK